jgi:carnitine 3-dehydrogenase
MSRRIQQVAVIGAGVIGAGWAAQFSGAGLDVVVSDPDPATEGRVGAHLERCWPALVRLGLADGATPRRIEIVNDPGLAAAEADFIQESGPELLDVKSDLIRVLDAAAGPDVVIASSSSGFAPSLLQPGCRHPERVIVGHPFHPVHLIPVVEVVGGPDEQSAARQATELYERIGKRPVRVTKELPGHIVNRLQAALWREAYWLMSIGAATVADIDSAISSGPGLRWALLGPFATQHLSGGPGGLARVLEQLGPPMAHWWETFETPVFDQRLIDQAVSGVNSELADLDTVQMETQRDQLLEQLLIAKAEADRLPAFRPQLPLTGLKP